jgi:hypothetical protein
MLGAHRKTAQRLATGGSAGQPLTALRFVMGLEAPAQAQTNE